MPEMDGHAVFAKALQQDADLRYSVHFPHRKEKRTIFGAARILWAELSANPCSNADLSVK